MTILVPKIWNDMLYNKNGKFCLNCQKNIIDFTQQKSKHNHLTWSISFGTMLEFAAPVLSQEKNTFNIEQANINQADDKKSITQTKIIGCVITDADFNDPLPNVTLSIENSTYSTTGNFGGKHSIAYDENLETNQQVFFSVLVGKELNFFQKMW